MTEPIAILAPRVNVNDDSVRLVRWLVEPGRWIEPGTAIAEIETTKAVVEMEAERSGHFAPQAEVGEELAVGEPMAWLLAQYDPALVPKRRKREAPAEGERLVSRDAAKLIAEHGLQLHDIPGAGPIRRADVESAISARAQQSSSQDWKGVIRELPLGPHSTIIYGADLQGTVVVDCLDAAEPGSAVVLVDDRPKHASVLGRPVLPASVLPELRARGFARAHVAIGTAAAKLACAKRLKDLGFAIVEVRHPTASISPSAKIGEGCFFGPLTLVGPETEIGSYTQINNGASVAHHTRVGEAVRLSDGVRLAGRVTVGDRAYIGLGVTVNDSITIGADTVIVSGANIFNHVAANMTVRIDGKAYPNRKA